MSKKLSTQCDSEIVKREVKKGTNKDTLFWGCSTYPKCRSTTIFESE